MVRGSPQLFGNSAGMFSNHNTYHFTKGLCVPERRSLGQFCSPGFQSGVTKFNQITENRRFGTFSSARKNNSLQWYSLLRIIWAGPTALTIPLISHTPDWNPGLQNVSSLRLCHVSINGVKTNLPNSSGRLTNNLKGNIFCHKLFYKAIDIWMTSVIY